MKCFTLNFFFCVFLICDGREESREPKFFFGQKPPPIAVSYRNVPKYVTEFVPSSCIVIDSTLSPCRHVRDVGIHPTAPTRIAKTKIPQVESLKSDQESSIPPQPDGSSVKTPTPPLGQVKSTQSPYWSWNFLNPFRIPGVARTVTKIQYVTTRVEDPQTVVSFHIKGCRPSRLPFDLPECPRPEPEPELQDESIVIMAPLKFITNADQAINPSKSVSNVDDGEENMKTAELNQTTPTD